MGQCYGFALTLTRHRAIDVAACRKLRKLRLNSFACGNPLRSAIELMAGAYAGWWLGQGPSLLCGDGGPV